SVDCLKELVEIIYEFASKGVSFGETLMSPEIKYYMKRSGLVKQAVHGSDKSKLVVTDKQFDAYWAENSLPPITLVTKKNAIATDGMRSVIDPWNHNMIVLKPQGVIGELQTAFADNEILPEEDVTYINANRGIRIAKWRVGEAGGQAGEYTQGSWHVVPVINSIEAIVNLEVRKTADTKKIK
ncbi:MAG: hypothetical protein ACQPRI_03945, partial [Solitalea-like symbiont of Tyrophagus putrescentiae]